MFMSMLANFSKGIWFSQGIYKFLKVTCQERRTSSMKVQFTPIQIWFINIAILNKRQTFGCAQTLNFFINAFSIFIESWSYLLIKLDMTTWCFLCVSYPSISFNNVFNLFSVFISFEISFVLQCKTMTSGWWRNSAFI